MMTGNEKEELMWVPGQAKECSPSSQFIWTCLASEGSGLHLLLGRLVQAGWLFRVPRRHRVCEQFKRRMQKQRRLEWILMEAVMESHRDT